VHPRELLIQPNKTKVRLMLDSGALREVAPTEVGTISKCYSYPVEVLFRPLKLITVRLWARAYESCTMESLPDYWNKFSLWETFWLFSNLKMHHLKHLISH
jgi:hypothetical protein